MIKRVITIVLLSSPLLFGCVCQSVIDQTFQNVEKEVLTDNLKKVNSNLGTYNQDIQQTTNALKKQTPEYKKLVEHEAALALKLQQALFELAKLVDAQSVKNKMLSEEIHTILKNNEGLIIIEKKLLEKERI